MENNIFLDKVIEFLVRGTRIDYDKEEIQFPFPFFYKFSLSSPVPFSFLSRLLSLFSVPLSSSFPKYCKDVYGLTNQEIRYVWDQYKDIITDKIENER